MQTLSRVLRFAHLVREVDERGFCGDFVALPHLQSASTARASTLALATKKNTLLCGHFGTGKLTLLKRIGMDCEKEGKRVAFVSSDGFRASRLGGFLLHHFIGLRLSRDGLPSQEQLEGTLERHVRLVESTYASCVPSLANIDVLVLDGVEKIDTVVLRAMDAVGRRQRQQLGKPFGGVRVFAAADFWRLPVYPSSDTGGNVYQLTTWNELFPEQVILRHSHHQPVKLGELTQRALFGSLTPSDMTRLESHQVGPSSSASSASGAKISGSSDPTHDRAIFYDPIVSNVDAISKYTPRFPKQPTIRTLPTRFRQLKQTEMGNFLVNMLVQSCTPVSFGLLDSLNVEVGNRVHLLLDGSKSFGIAAGSVGEVMQVREHAITVHFFAQYRTVDVPRMKVVCYHPFYPEVRYELRQFPLFPRQRLCPVSILNYPNAYFLRLNGRRMADTNDLGNLLARMRNLNDFVLEHTADIAHLDGMVHEPTRIYYHQAMGKPMSEAAEHWCRNCKSFVPMNDFFTHWEQCVRSVRWCTECSKVIPLELLEPHREKHQIVLCLDCGQAVEWRQWEGHRLSCGAMMREVGADNEFLPLRTRQLALELGLDKRDLHTMRNITKSMLPASRTSVR